MKTCTRCKKEKPLEQYSKYKQSKDGIDYYCKPCRTAIAYNSRSTKSIKCTWKDCDRSHWAYGLCRMHHARKERGSDMDSPRDSINKYSNLKKRYKLDQETYDEMAKNGCYICGSREFLNVDHDHACCDKAPTCGKCVRGIVCQSCNISLGKLERGTIHIENQIKPQMLQYILDYELKKKSLG